MTLKYLITGATGGLGKNVLRYFVESVPLSDFAAASSKASNKTLFEERGIGFRHVNYADASSLDEGLHDVENLLFVSGNSSSRMEQHAALIDAAKKAGVKHVCCPLSMPTPESLTFPDLVYLASFRWPREQL